MATELAIARVDISEFAEQDRPLLRRVQQERAIVVVTDGENVIARIEPPAQIVDPEEHRKWWEEHDRLSQEISEHWPEGVSAEDAIADVRREL